MPRSKRRKRSQAESVNQVQRAGIVPVLLLLITVACAGCVAKDDAPPPPENRIAATLDSQDDTDWIYRNQFKSHMRHMWIDSNIIVSAGRGELRPTFFEIRPAAADIRARAELMGGYWRTLREQAEEMEWILEDEDRIGATESLRTIGAACDGCHIATWSPAYLHVTTNTLEHWIGNRPTPHGEDEKDAEPPPPVPNRVLMQRLWRDYQSLENGIESWDVVLAQESVNLLLPEIEIRERAWTQIAALAGEIEQAAKEEDANALKEPYLKMASHCAACHARLAGGDRKILNPMPWDGPAE